MLQSPLYIDTKCTTGSSPPVLGCGRGVGAETAARATDGGSDGVTV